jgi:hypothetical protein
LKTKIKEQEHSINELSSAVELFLKIQPIIKKLQENILKILKQTVALKINVTVSNIDQEIVKPFAPSLEKSVDRQCEIWYRQCEIWYRQEFTMSLYQRNIPRHLRKNHENV